MPLGMEAGLGPGHIVLDGDPAPPTERSAATLTFRPMSIVAKRLPISRTTELLLSLDDVKFLFGLKDVLATCCGHTATLTGRLDFQYRLSYL